MVAAPLTDLLKGMKKGKKKGPFLWVAEAEQAFRALQACFLDAPLLQHFNPEKQSQVETDAFIIGLSGILSQPSDDSPQGGRVIWKPVVFYSRKLIPAEKNYITGDFEMLAIVASFKEWRHYLKSPAYPV